MLVAALPGNWKMQAEAHTGRRFVDYVALSNNRCVSELNTGVEHARLRATGEQSNASIISEDAGAHRSPLRHGVKAQTKRGKTHINTGRCQQLETHEHKADLWPA